MISKPLFKQSCKSNAVSWTFVTVITSFMLAILIIVLGSIDVSAIRSSMTDMFVTDAVESTVNKQSITYYGMTSDALTNYELLKEGLVSFEEKKSLNPEKEDSAIIDEIILEKGFEDSEKINTFKIFILGVPNGEGKLENGATSISTLLKGYNKYRKLPMNINLESSVVINTFVESLHITDEKAKTDMIDLLSKYDKTPRPENITPENFYNDNKAQTFTSLNFVSSAIYNKVKEEQGEMTANIAKGFIDDALVEFSNIQTGILPQAFVLSYIPGELAKAFVEQSFPNNGETIYINHYYNELELSNMSESAIISYNANMQVKREQIQAEVQHENSLLPETEQKTEKELNAEVERQLAIYSQEYIKSQTGTLLEDLPQEVAEALQELGSMDIYALVIGSIFFRIAGLLLPIIFIIMTSNNLIASQVDTGSMAYVLSTPTKRRTVSITQMLYLITSLLGMFAITTVTGLVSLAIAGQGMTITYTDMLLFNLGAFITTFAISGICFLASSFFNRSKQAMAVGGGISMFSLVATILGLFGSDVMPKAVKIDAMNSFNYISLISLFDTTSIMAGSLSFLWKLAILVGIGVVTYFLSVKKFEKKDLPL